MALDAHRHDRVDVRAARAAAGVPAGTCTSPLRARSRALCRAAGLPRDRARAVESAAHERGRGGRAPRARGAFTSRGGAVASAARQAAALRVHRARARVRFAAATGAAALRAVHRGGRPRHRRHHLGGDGGLVLGLARGHPRPAHRALRGASVGARGAHRTGGPRPRRAAHPGGRVARVPLPTGQ